MYLLAARSQTFSGINSCVRDNFVYTFLPTAKTHRLLSDKYNTSMRGWGGAAPTHTHRDIGSINIKENCVVWEKLARELAGGGRAQQQQRQKKNRI